MEFDKFLIENISKYVPNLLSYNYYVNGNYIVVRTETSVNLSSGNIDILYNIVKDKSLHKIDGQQGYYTFDTYPTYNTYEIVNKYITFIRLKAEYYLSEKIYEKLDGPISITEYYSDEYGMHIYLFGDIHFKGLCSNDNIVQIDDFMEKTVQLNKNLPIDIYLEIPYIGDVLYPQTIESKSYIHNVENKFYDCIYKKDKCKYPNLRVHYADFRSLHGDDFIMRNTQRGAIYKVMVMLTKDLSNELYLFGALEQMLKKIRPVLAQSKSENMFDTMYMLYDVNGKITKQYQNIQDKSIVSTIRQYYSKIYDNPDFSKSTILNMIDSIIHDISVDPSKSIILHGKIKNIFIKILLPILDIYMLGRIFRTYKQKNAKYSSQAKNIMLYAGQHHIVHIGNVLELLRFNKINITGIDTDKTDEIFDQIFTDIDKFKDIQCNDITSFTQPFLIVIMKIIKYLREIT